MSTQVPHRCQLPPWQRCSIRERKQAEAGKELLLHEIKHRVKNTLAMVQSVATQSFRTAPAEEKNAFLLRLNALADAHDLLTQREWKSANALQTIELALRPFATDGGRRICALGPSIDIAPNRALLLAMLVHELGTNAVKYGALSDQRGTVSVVWNAELKGEKQFISLRWEESGGPAVKPPTRKGFGTNMIERAVRGEGGDVCLDFAPAGLLCEIRIPVD